jgi:hypothetical protein
MTTIEDFALKLAELAITLRKHFTTENGQWAVTGLIDNFRKVYAISSDTKIVSKILEIYFFQQNLAFAQINGYKIVLAEHRSYYPDISFAKSDDESIGFAVNFKTKYRNPEKPPLCNGFTLGSHGENFISRASRKNIQF